jgi:hypothetical protein
LILHKNSKPATKAEKARIDGALVLGCVCCNLAGYKRHGEKLEAHHILSGGKRMGHWFVIALCIGHHQGYFSARQQELIASGKLVAISDGRKLFNAAFDSERSLWIVTQEALHLPTDWPASKILPRRVA